ncbi:hypothetical protein [Vibrio phage vB_VpaS_CHI]|nr:hypothetical protein [Vibrio phage vB_VpaS_ALK]USL90078.1 hypothetical protein [Vibrio phage vB_VpaS_CHI]
MTTKQMHAHLMQSGCAFTKNDQSYWVCTLAGDFVADHRQLGQLVWKAARLLGED